MQTTQWPRTLIFSWITALLLGFSFSAYADIAPEFNLPSNNGSVSLSDYRGKVVLVDFWASWCGPCRQSFPWMNAMTEKYKSQGLEIVAINLDQEPQLAQDFLSQFPANFHIAFDPEGKTPEAFNVMGMPTAFLVDRKGRVASQHIGFHQEKTIEYEASLKALLQQ